MSLRTPAQQGSHLPALEDEELEDEELQISELTLSEQVKEELDESHSEVEDSVDQLSEENSQPLEVDDSGQDVELEDSVQGAADELELELEELELEDGWWTSPSQTGRSCSAQVAAAVMVPAFN